MSNPIPTPTNCWTKTEQLFADALAGTPAFQQFVNAADAADALCSIYGEQLDLPAYTDAYTLEEQDQRHARYAMLHSSNDSPFSLQRNESGFFEPSGVMSLYLERRLTEAQRHEYAEIPSAAWREWKNICGGILYGLLAWFNANGGPHVDGVDVPEYGSNTEEKWASEGQIQGCQVEITWGFQQ